MKFSFGVLRIAPDVFWNMTMIEFLATFEGYGNTQPKGKDRADAPMTRNELEQMMQLHPD